MANTLIRGAKSASWVEWIQMQHAKCHSIPPPARFILKDTRMTGWTKFRAYSFALGVLSWIERTGRVARLRGVGAPRGPRVRPLLIPIVRMETGMSAPAHKHGFRKRDEELDRYINLKLAALGQPVSRSASGSDFLALAGPLLRNYYQKDRQLGNWLCASDSRIQDFLDGYLGDVCPQGAARLPANAFVLDREGMARVLSLPVTSDSFSSPYLDSYRLPQGVLHNPRSDKRTTQGLFHIAEGRSEEH